MKKETKAERDARWDTEIAAMLPAWADLMAENVVGKLTPEEFAKRAQELADKDDEPSPRHSIPPAGRSL